VRDRSSKTPTVVVAQFLYRDEAEIARAHLAAEGIQAIVLAEDEGGLNPGFFSEYRVVVIVNSGDATAAREVLGIGQPLVVPEEIRRAVLAHSRWAYPNEACGLLAGDDMRVSLVFCLTNRLHSPSRYTIDPREHFGAMRYAERQGLAIVGAWHSHPAGDATLSGTDIASSPGGSWITMVVGNSASPDAAVRAFRTEDGRAIERPLEANPTG
jgi:proteasome lid subunit RPN8/RPN11